MPSDRRLDAEHERRDAHRSDEHYRDPQLAARAFYVETARKRWLSPIIEFIRQ